MPERGRLLPAALAAPIALCCAVGAAATEPAAFAVVNGGIAAALAPVPGDAGRGRAIIADRRKGLCLLCHSGPFPEERFQGDLAPSLAGAGARNSVPQLRARMVDSRQVAPGTIMPPYYSLAGLTRVAPAVSGKTLLNAQEIEDVVAFLSTLRD